MTPLTVVAIIRAFPEKYPVVRAELQQLIAPTRAEEGCLNYDLHEDTEDPALFIFHENWASPEDLDRHLESAHIKACLTAIDGMLESADIRRMRRIDVG
jgi:quinol monooxygenase YgiN